MFRPNVPAEGSPTKHPRPSPLHQSKNRSVLVLSRRKEAYAPMHQIVKKSHDDLIGVLTIEQQEFESESRRRRVVPDRSAEKTGK
jgi:hypothetical protein